MAVAREQVHGVPVAITKADDVAVFLIGRWIEFPEIPVREISRILSNLPHPVKLDRWIVISEPDEDYQKRIPKAHAGVKGSANSGIVTLLSCKYLARIGDDSTDIATQAVRITRVLTGLLRYATKRLQVRARGWVDTPHLEEFAATGELFLNEVTGPELIASFGEIESLRLPTTISDTDDSRRERPSVHLQPLPLPGSGTIGSQSLSPHSQKRRIIAQVSEADDDLLCSLSTMRREPDVLSFDPRNQGKPRRSKQKRRPSFKAVLSPLCPPSVPGSATRRSFKTEHVRPRSDVNSTVPKTTTPKTATTTTTTTTTTDAEPRKWGEATA